MKAILIDVWKKTVEYVDLLDDNDKREKQIHDLIKCRIFTLGAILPGDDVLYVNDEGLFNSDLKIFHIVGYHPLAGNGIIVGKELVDLLTDEWTLADVTTKIEDIEVKYLTEPQAIEEDLRWRNGLVNGLKE